MSKLNRSGNHRRRPDDCQPLLLGAQGVKANAPRHDVGLSIRQGEQAGAEGAGRGVLDAVELDTKIPMLCLCEGCREGGFSVFVHGVRCCHGRSLSIPLDAIQSVTDWPHAWRRYFIPSGTPLIRIMFVKWSSPVTLSVAHHRSTRR